MLEFFSNSLSTAWYNVIDGRILLSVPDSDPIVRDEEREKAK